METFLIIRDILGHERQLNTDSKPHRILISPLLLTTETGFRIGDTLDLAYHEVAHLWEQHHGEGFCQVEGKLRQSVQRWMMEREVLAGMVGDRPYFG